MTRRIELDKLIFYADQCSDRILIKRDKYGINWVYMHGWDWPSWTVTDTVVSRFAAWCRENNIALPDPFPEIIDDTPMKLSGTGGKHYKPGSTPHSVFWSAANPYGGGDFTPR